MANRLAEANSGGEIGAPLRRRLTVTETVDKDHGRIEIRRYALSDGIDWLEAKPDWAGLQAVGPVESTRSIGDQTSTECRYFLCSFPDQD
jgi:hypothetical protein